LLTDDKQKKMERLERALKGYEDSAHLSYPRMVAAISLVQASEFAQEQQPVFRTILRSYYNCFKDESFRPEDQPEIAEMLVNGWAEELYDRVPGAFGATTRSIGPEFSWLANVLEGDSRINLAWRFRGSGFASTVTEDGWKNFSEQLAGARTNLVAAWTERPDLPLAPAQMVRVSMAESDSREMRLWFDRAIAAQIDYPSAWSNMRWGLRPRWNGNVETMLAFGKRAVETGRFDTDVPRKFMDVISDAESDLELPVGDHIIGRPEIWADVKRLYEGYIADGPTESRDGWRSAYAIVSYLAGHYDVSRAQLQAIDWKPRERNLHYWGRDLSLVALEVAARTGSLGSRVTEAEARADRDDPSGALQIYEQIKGSPEADERTRRFLDYRRRILALEKSVQARQWTSLLPESTNDPAWYSVAGRTMQAGPDGLELESGPYGHMLLCRARVGTAFEIKGAFEVVKAPSAAFEAGVGFGQPNWWEKTWYSFRATRNDFAKAGANFARGWSYIAIRDRPAELKPGKNEFHFRFKNDYLTASINGREVMTDVEVGERAHLNLRHHILALTGDTKAGTILRYHSLQARRLPLP
jgi:hypothetical protein